MPALASKPAPRLTLRFAAWTAAGFSVAAIVIFALVRHDVTAQAERDAVGRTKLAAHAALTPALRKSDVVGPVSTARRGQLDRLLAGRVLLDGIVRGSVLDRSGKVVYSSDHRLIGRRVSQAGWLPRALAGETVSHVGSAGSGSRRMLQTFVPITLHGTRVVGVAELDQRYEPIAASARRTALLIAGVLEALLLLLVVALAPMLARASSRLRKQIDELDYVASHDDLMALPNRLGFQRALDRVTAANQPASLLLVDLDSFHAVNEILGSSCGDSLLAQWADRLRPESIGSEVVARLGEDEVGILAVGHTPDDVEAVVARVREAQRESADVGGVRIALDAAIGAVLIPEHGNDFDTLLRHAGVALRTAKQNRDKFALFEPGEETTDRWALTRVAELRDAIDTEQFEVYYQPLADLATRAICGVEALLRWQHPSQGLLKADRFIDVAEHVGVIAELDRFVFKRAVQQWQEWNALGIQLDLAVNLAAAALLDTQLPNDIATMLTAFATPAQHLTLEITERSILGNEQKAREVLETLREIGVQLAIDDYGAGYSSLTYLHQFPVQQVKLDRSFIEHLPDDARDKAIVRSTTELAHALGATVVVEGIERPEQFVAAAQLGCDLGQGHFISPPLTANGVTKLLSQGWHGSRLLDSWLHAEPRDARKVRVLSRAL